LRTAVAVSTLIALALVSGCSLLQNSPPTASLAASRTSGETPLAVEFDGSGSTAVGRIVEYRWDFGDEAAYATAAGQTASHVYERPGEFIARLTVTDECGAVGSQSVVILVENRPPVPSCRFSNDAPVPGELVQFDASGSFDPDGVVVDFRWDFGDGTTRRGTRVSHVYEEVALYTVHLTIEDDAGGTASIDHTMTVHLSTPGGGCGG
jgi:PKD repeat protein